MRYVSIAVSFCVLVGCGAENLPGTNSGQPSARFGSPRVSLPDARFSAEPMKPLPCLSKGLPGRARAVQIGPFSDRTPYAVFVTTEHVGEGEAFRTVCGMVFDPRGAAWHDLPDPWPTATRSVAEVRETPIGVMKDGLIVPLDPHGIASVNWEGERRLFMKAGASRPSQENSFVALLTGSDMQWVGLAMKRRIDFYGYSGVLQPFGTVLSSDEADYHGAAVRTPSPYRQGPLKGLAADVLVWTEDNHLRLGFKSVAELFPPASLVAPEAIYERTANEAVSAQLTQPMFAAALADLNGDGTQDLVVLPYGSSELLFAPSDGFVFQPLRGTGLIIGGATSLAVGHLNDDAFPDVAVAFTDGSMAVYLAVPPGSR